MAEMRYRDRYAQVRQTSPHNRSVCYWRNNLSVKDFRKEGDFLILDDSGTYNGLNVSLSIRVEEAKLKKMFRKKIKGEIEFWGSPNHMGIMVRMKTDLFSKTCKGSAEGYEYKFRMDGTVRGLSFIGLEEIDRRRKKIQESVKKERKNRDEKAVC